jgi:hypothetical protein
MNCDDGFWDFGVQMLSCGIRHFFEDLSGSIDFQINVNLTEIPAKGARNWQFIPSKPPHSQNQPRWNKINGF